MTSLFVHSRVLFPPHSGLSRSNPAHLSKHPLSTSSSVRFSSCAKRHQTVSTRCTASSSGGSSGSNPPSSTPASSSDVRTCRNCKQPFSPADNHPMACRHHTAHYGGETKRKFESVYTGGTMNTVGGGEITAYWHCCGATDPFDPGCVAGPHETYDD
ncbi:unnamed protein product [Closterium sp. Yama58-4]|nr:unnamed protein product [Closterium sp. Yama58-4]